MIKSILFFIIAWLGAYSMLTGFNNKNTNKKTVVQLGIKAAIISAIALAILMFIVLIF